MHLVWEQERVLIVKIKMQFSSLLFVHINFWLLLLKLLIRSNCSWLNNIKKLGLDRHAHSGFGIFSRIQRHCRRILGSATAWLCRVELKAFTLVLVLILIFLIVVFGKSGCDCVGYCLNFYLQLFAKNWYDRMVLEGVKPYFYTLSLLNLWENYTLSPLIITIFHFIP